MRSSNPPDAARSIRVLFLCLGNYCRSPMAEAVFQHLVNEAGLSSRIEVDSAGLGPWHVGQPPHRGTTDMLRRNRIPYNDVGRQIEQTDLDHFDYIVAMDRENLSGLRRLNAQSRGEVILLLAEAYRQGRVRVDEVPDPYYEDGFDYVYGLVFEGCRALLDHIREKHF